MRLFLSSYGFGSDPKNFLRLFQMSGKRVLIIANAQDDRYAEVRTASVDRDLRQLYDLNMDASELDLRNYFDDQVALEKILGAADGVWVRGGNTFVLRRAFARSGADSVMLNLLLKDSLVFGGYSAGTLMLTPSLRGYELLDDSTVVPEGYPTEVSMDGMGIVSFQIIPHSQSPDLEKLERYYLESGVPYKALRDGEVLIVDGDRQETLP